MNRTQNYGELAASVAGGLVENIQRQEAINVLQAIVDGDWPQWERDQAAAGIAKLRALIGEELDDQRVRVAARFAFRYAGMALRISGGGGK